MKTQSITSSIFVGLLLLGAGCASSASDTQREALGHQQRADEAAKRGAYGVAAKEQREAQDTHHDAVVKAMKEGTPLPPQTEVGDKPVQ